MVRISRILRKCTGYSINNISYAVHLIFYVAMVDFMNFTASEKQFNCLNNEDVSQTAIIISFLSTEGSED